MLGKCEDAALHINKEDIPLTASSEPMVNLIKELEECDTADDLSNCLSDEHVWNLISACHWPYSEKQRFVKIMFPLTEIREV